MRIAARWFGWYSLAAASAALLAMVFSVWPALWLDPPERLSKSDNDKLELMIRELNELPAGRRHHCMEPVPGYRVSPPLTPDVEPTFR